ncbi:mycothiol transferase [Gordonia sp. DT30]|uniref:mycothiol transferase n=1 Tax=unclassified Gordonia (in: high G+C Gram-positive bacteria) TaxID=2657482 RepID=UPI003CF0B7B6
MRATEVLADGFQRVKENVHSVLDGIEEARLTWQPAEGANTIAWLVWHLARVQDAQIADVAGTDQIWTIDGWYDRFALPFPPSATGYGQSPEDVIRVVGPVELLLGYYDATHRATVDYLVDVDDADLDRIIDTNWDPPVTLGVRLVSIVDDDAQHVGQAAYLRGLDVDLG